MESGGPGLEACVAQLTYTGFVHADPHEGNLLLDRSDGSLVFLDFGLVSEVEPFVMVGDGTGAAFTRTPPLYTLSFTRLAPVCVYNALILASHAFEIRKASE